MCDPDTSSTRSWGASGSSAAPAAAVAVSCMASSLRDAAAICVLRLGGFSTMRLYDTAGCAAAEVPPPAAGEEDLQERASGRDGAAHCSAFEARIANALLAAANAVEATPLADALRGDAGGAAAPRLRAVVLPPGVRAAGGDGDAALRWAPDA